MIIPGAPAYLMVYGVRMLTSSCPFSPYAQIARLDGTTIVSSSKVYLQDQCYHYLSHPESAVSHGTYDNST